MTKSLRSVPATLARRVSALRSLSTDVRCAAGMSVSEGVPVKAVTESLIADIEHADLVDDRAESAPRVGIVASVFLILAARATSS